MSTPSICRQTVVVDLENGLHLVPCSQIAQLARRFDGEIRIRNGKNSVDAKNVLDLMTLRAEFGATLELEADGDDAASVIQTLVKMFEQKFENREPSAS